MWWHWYMVDPKKRRMSDEVIAAGGRVPAAWILIARVWAVNQQVARDKLSASVPFVLS